MNADMRNRIVIEEIENTNNNIHRTTHEGNVFQPADATFKEVDLKRY